MAEPTFPSKKKSRWSLLARLVKTLGLGSIFYLLALPLVALSTCAGPVVKISGYQALSGVSFPAADFGIPAGQYPDYGSDWWVAGLGLMALVGIGSAWLGGIRGALIGIGAAIIGLIVLQPAIGFFNSPQDNNIYWSADAGQGGSAIFLAFAGSIVIDLGWISARSWSEFRSTPPASRSNRGDWLALALASTFFLVLIGLGILALVVVVLLTRSSS